MASRAEKNKKQKNSRLRQLIDTLVFFLLIGGILVSRLIFWEAVRVEGHSMDPTLAEGQHLIVFNQNQIDRYDIVVATETDDNGKEKKIVKRVIGMPGDQIEFKQDTLYVNGEEVEETYLADYKAAFQADKLQNTYSYSKYFQSLAQASPAFTVNRDGQTDFSVTVPEGEYYLLGDDRIVSKDSRDVGTFKADQIKGEVVLRFWPFNSFKLLHE
ncbi:MULTISPECIES: signal peptidase I [unclassified Streptococcus]|uniref:signal peptidase I n=1 Tax=unclassified Streptococcus TaxID=2608887 RepID=UPI0018A8BB5D|nr:MULTISPECIES: signal peptidase I [unclassified Streptococcus]MBF8970672.1 signal peptidase I [Streptococcus sp. NLN76]MBJ6746409.1 signal peptidase I [Streptococcus sp. 121]